MLQASDMSLLLYARGSPKAATPDVDPERYYVAPTNTIDILSNHEHNDGLSKLNEEDVIAMPDFIWLCF